MAIEDDLKIEKMESIKNWMKFEMMDALLKECKRHDILINDSDLSVFEDIKYEIDPILFKFLRRKING